MKKRMDEGMELQQTAKCAGALNETEGLKLRPYRAEDCAAIAQWIKDARAHALWCANLLPYPFDEDSFERVRMEGERRWGYKSFVVTADDGERIGYFQMNRNPQDHSAFLGFVIVNDALRGKGYGANMLKLIKEYAFSVMNAEKIMLRVFDVNEAAVRCYRNAGFSVTEHTAADFSFQKEKWGRFVMEAYRKMWI